MLSEPPGGFHAFLLTQLNDRELTLYASSWSFKFTAKGLLDKVAAHLQGVSGWPKERPGIPADGAYGFLELNIKARMLMELTVCPYSDHLRASTSLVL